MSTKKSSAIAKLQKLNIRTTADLDTYIQAHPKVTKNGPYAGQRYLPSRYEVLCDLVGEWVAAVMMQELAIQQCTPAPRKK